MKVNVYYGGRGLIDDPTIYVINKMIEVLDELRVSVEKINLFEQKSSIATLPQTLKDADGIILAASVEWFGIGGYMQQFLDACWLFGNKDKIKTMYMQPVVMSTTYGEKDAELTLISAWEILGGKICDGVCGYVDNVVDFEMNKSYQAIIEKKAENLYRTISQKMINLPSSNGAVTSTVGKAHHIDLTPKESELLSKHVADDSYMKKQKEDIEELSSMFKGMLSKKSDQRNVDELEQSFNDAFTPNGEFEAVYEFNIAEKSEPFHIIVSKTDVKCYYGPNESSDITIKISMSVLSDITSGRMSFQRAFMTGEMTSRGDFKILRMLDQLFVFKTD